jgi:hypothetical protein
MFYRPWGYARPYLAAGIGYPYYGGIDSRYWGYGYGGYGYPYYYGRGYNYPFYW